MAEQFNRMIEILNIAREAMGEQITVMSRSGFKDRAETEEVLRINRDLAQHVQALRDLMMEDGAADDMLSVGRDLTEYFQASDQLLSTMFETTRLEFIAENGGGPGVRLRKTERL